MAIHSIDDLLVALRKSRLVPSDQFALVVETARSQASPAEALAKLAELGFITSWHSERLLAGLVSFTVDKYKLLEQIGQGGMGAVFKAEHTVMGRTVALKVLSNARLQNSAAVARFRREVKAAAALDHPNIITAHDAGEVGGIHYLVMEYVAGADLNAWNRAHGLLPTVWAAEFARQAALGLEHARKLGMVHRDIKPGNILVSWDDPRKAPTVKILDLGLARFIRDEEEDGSLSGIEKASASTADSSAPGSTMDESLTQFGQVLGTPDYLAPEQIQRTHDADIRADIFSLGCTLFKILTGQYPFGGSTVWEKLEARTNPSAPPAILLRTLRPDAPAGLEAITARMLARDVEARYQTPGELASDLEPFGWAAASQSSGGGAGTFDPGSLSGIGIGSLTSPSAASSLSMEFVRATGSPRDDSGTRAFLGALEQGSEDDEPSTPPPTATVPPPLPSEAAAPTARPLRPLPQFAPAVGAAMRDEPETLVDAPEHPSSGHVLPNVHVSSNRMPRPRSELDARREMLIRRRQRSSSLPVFLAGVISMAVVGAVLWLASRPGVAPNRPTTDIAQKADKTDKVDPKKAATPESKPGRGGDDWKNLPTWHPEHKSKYPGSEGKHGSESKYPDKSHGTDSKGGKEYKEIKEDEETGVFPARPKEEPKRPEKQPEKQPPKTPVPVPPRTAFVPQPVDPLLELILEGHSREITSVAISPDGRTALSGSADRTVRLWDLTTGEELQSFEGHEETVTAVAFMSGGSRAVSASRDMTVRVWDLTKPRELYLLKGHTAPVTHLATSPDSTIGLVTGGDDAVRVWSVASRTNRAIEHPGEILVSVKYTNTGPRAFFGGGSDPLNCYNAVTKEILVFVKNVPQINSIAVSRDGRLLAEGLAMGMIAVLDVKRDTNGELIRYPAHSGGVASLVFTADAEYVVSGGADKNVFVHKVDGTAKATLKGHTAAVTSVSVAREGDKILSGSLDKTLRLWRFPDKAPHSTE